MRYGIGLLIVVTLALTGCDTTKAKSAQLARVAKDWCLTVRASQVLPVYPLSEDVQPGDVFLVHTPLEEQVRIYEDRGFLPLENLAARLNPGDYAAFYQGAYHVAPDAKLPQQWQFPPGAALGANDWASAPLAAFPSYTFTVKRGEGINLAVPIQGVPVGLSAMQSRSAHGSVSITDAHTYGIDMESLYARVKDWAKDNRELLRSYAPVETKPGQAPENLHYLRVVQRVYLASRVNVSLLNDDAFNAGVSGGAEKKVDLFDVATTNAVANYASMLTALNKTFTDAMPGGTLKVAAASSRSVSMSETFPRPLVIGYIGFDLPILQNGQLGRPESTHGQLTQTTNPTRPRYVSAEQFSLEELMERVADRPQADALWEKAAGRIPEFQELYKKCRAQNLTPAKAFLFAKNSYFNDETAQGSKHRRLIEALQATLDEEQ